MRPIAPPLRVLVLLFLAGALVACAGESPASEPASEAEAAPPAAASSPHETSAALEGGTPINAEGLSFTLPAGWTPEEPSSRMRIGQAVIPGSGGNGELTVFFFGPGGGGGAEANIGRWIAQMADATEPKQETVEANGLNITVVDTSGTLKKSTIGSFPSEDMPGYRLFGAVVEGPGGPWYLKAVGPQATMEEQRSGFKAMLMAAAPAG